MSEPTTSGIQFDRAEYESTHAAEIVCAQCKQPAIGEYFTMNGIAVCTTCRSRIQGAFEQSLRNAGVGRAFVRGGGVALVCSMGWYAIVKLTHLEIGLIAIGIGFLVGRVVRQASGNVGGRRYQVLAAALTYAAITLSYVPAVLEGLQRPRPTAAAVSPANSPADARSPRGAASPHATVTADIPPPMRVARTPDPGASDASTPHEKPGLLKAVGMLALAMAFVVALAFAAPFLGGLQNVIGLLIIGFALVQAWRLNRASTITTLGPFRLEQGPYRTSTSTSTSAIIDATTDTTPEHSATG